MTQIEDLLDFPALLDEVMAGNVRLQTHPEFPELTIANYTDQCAFDRNWNEVTRICRGLIWNAENGEVLARPFPKFFNFDEPQAPRILDDDLVWYYDNKYDGSLGIMYERPDGGLAIATRGSFASEQAALADKLLAEFSADEYEHHVRVVQDGFTPLFEICGPDNRIVLNYDTNFLAFLGDISIEHGYFLPPRPQTRTTMRTLLADLSRTNAEGWVVWKSTYQAVKIKQADYVELHRIVSNLSEKEVWRQLRAGTYRDFVVKLPDEWHPWAEGIADRLRDEHLHVHMDAEAYENTIRHYSSDRKTQALYMNRHFPANMRGLVFSLLDGKDISDSIWRMIEPKG